MLSCCVSRCTSKLNAQPKNKKSHQVNKVKRSKEVQEVSVKSISPYKVKKSSQGQQILTEGGQQGPPVPTRSRSPYKVVKQ